MLLSVIMLSGKEEAVEFRKLNAVEKQVIENKGTEAPFSGKYWEHFEEGSYKCKRCGVPLFRSNDKFKSGCGWPSFDDEIEGAILQISDSDGIRTEIVCAHCNAHLGHVFVGEGFTEKNTRHCVNSISLKFEPSTETSGWQKIIIRIIMNIKVEYLIATDQ